MQKNLSYKKIVKLQKSKIKKRYFHKISKKNKNKNKINKIHKVSKIMAGGSGKYPMHLPHNCNLQGKCPNEQIKKRIIKEIEQFKTSENYIINYTNFNFDDIKCHIYMTYKKKYFIKIIYNENYPFSIPCIYVNDVCINIYLDDIEWTSSHKLGKIHTIIQTYYTKYLNKNNNNNNNNNNNKKYNKKVLILCHNKNVKGSFNPLQLENHFYGIIDKDNPVSFFENLFSDYKLEGIPKFDTVDTIPGGTFIDDAFSREFINKHIEEYDLIMVPDCGGPWEKLVSIKSNSNNLFNTGLSLTQDEINKNKTHLIELSLSLTEMLKPNGIIQFGKFISNTPCTIKDKAFPDFMNALFYYLQQNNFTAQIKNVDGIGNTIIAVKNKK